MPEARFVLDWGQWAMKTPRSFMRARSPPRCCARSGPSSVGRPRRKGRTGRRRRRRKPDQGHSCLHPRDLGQVLRQVGLHRERPYSRCSCPRPSISSSVQEGVKRGVRIGAHVPYYPSSRQSSQRRCPRARRLALSSRRMSGLLRSMFTLPTSALHARSPPAGPSAARSRGGGSSRTPPPGVVGEARQVVREDAAGPPGL